MASGYLALTSRYWRMRAVGALGAAASTLPYSFAAPFFFDFAGAPAGAALLLRVPRFRLRRALYFFWLMRRRIFIERRLSRRPMRTEYWLATSVSRRLGGDARRDDLLAVLDAHLGAHRNADVQERQGHAAPAGQAGGAGDAAGARLGVA